MAPRPSPVLDFSTPWDACVYPWRLFKETISMSIRPYRVSKIRSAALWSVSLGATALLWAFSPYVATAAGDDPTSVLNKMAAVYSNAKTFQASLTSKEVGTGKDGKQFSLTGTQEIRYKAPNMFNVVTKSVGAGALAGKKPDGSYMVDPGKVIINSDGKTITIYSETKNQYIRQPAGPTIPLVGVFSLLQHIPGPKTPGIYMDNATTVGGRPAYVVAVKRVMPPNLTADQKKQWEESAKGAQPLKIMVDKQTY